MGHDGKHTCFNSNQHPEINHSWWVCCSLHEIDSTGFYSTSGEVNAHPTSGMCWSKSVHTLLMHSGFFVCAMQACKDDLGIESALTDEFIVTWSWLHRMLWNVYNHFYQIAFFILKLFLRFKPAWYELFLALSIPWFIHISNSLFWYWAATYFHSYKTVVAYPDISQWRTFIHTDQ